MRITGGSVEEVDDVVGFEGILTHLYRMSLISFHSAAVLFPHILLLTCLPTRV
jgi:hypothetical protein